MRILFTNIVLKGGSGTETLTRDLALSMARRGHRCAIYTHRIGALGHELAAQGIEVTEDISALEGPFDVIHAHHTSVASIAIARFPNVPSLFVCHDLTAWHDAAPAIARFAHFVAVGPAAARRLADVDSVPETRIAIIPNGVDQTRFKPGPPLPETCRTALAFCKTGDLIEPVQEACRRTSIRVDHVGAGVGRVEGRCEDLLPRYDLVFASGLAAREALTCGRALVCVDERGLGGMVDPARFEEWGGNFGFASLSQPLDPDRLAAEIARYDARKSEAVASVFRREGSIDLCASRYEAVYGAIAGTPTTADATTLADLAITMERLFPRIDEKWAWMVERDRLLRRIAVLERLASRSALPLV